MDLQVGLSKSSHELRQSGFVLVTMVVSLVAVLACLGLAIDVGYLQLIKSRMQTAADASAIGGVQELKANGNANVVTAAKSDSAANGFANGTNSVTVTVNMPPLSGYYTADPTAVEVIISQNVKVLFMSVLGFRTVTVTARSVAHEGPGSGCLYALDPSASNAIQVTNGATVSVNCGVVINSSSATALSVIGGSHLTASSISITGNYQVIGGSSISPTPSTGVVASGDPLSYLTPPAVGSCNQTNFSVGGGQTKPIGPGVYCNGITISNGATVTMSSGTYILEGGGFNISGGAKVSGSGVTIYLTSGSGYSYGPVNISNGTTLQLSAPTTGSYPGILFYQNPAISSPAASTFGGGSTMVFNGALYFPGSALSYSNGVGANYTILVAKTISFSGGSTFNADYSSLPGGTPVKGSAALGE